MRFSWFGISLGSAEALVRWGGKVKHVLTSHVLSNISAKKFSTWFTYLNVIARQSNGSFETQCIYTVSGKRWHSIFASNFVKCWSIFKILQAADYISGKVIIKYPIIPQTRRYKLPCEMFVSKNQMPQSWVQRNPMQHSAIQNSCCYWC